MNEKRLPTKILVGGRAFTVNVVTDGSIGDDLGQLLYLGKNSSSTASGVRLFDRYGIS